MIIPYSNGDPPTNRAASSDPAVPPPTILGMAASFAGSIAKFVASGFKLVDEQTQRLRVDQCSRCPYRRENRCAICGCYFAKKAWLPHEDCSIGRWTV